MQIVENTSGYSVEKQIKLLETMIMPNSESAYILDKANNYHASVHHHAFIVNVVDKIKALEKKMGNKFSFDPRNTENLLG